MAGGGEEEESGILAITQVGNLKKIEVKEGPQIALKYHFWEVLPHLLHIIEPWFLRGETIRGLMMLEVFSTTARTI